MAEHNSAPLPVGVNTMSFMWRASAREALEMLAREGYRRFEVMAQRAHLDPMMERAEAAAFARFLRDAGLTMRRSTCRAWAGVTGPAPRLGSVYRALYNPMYR